MSRAQGAVIALSRARAVAAGLVLAAIGALLLGGVAPTLAEEIDWAKAETVTVVMTEYRFDPEHLAFRHGVPYRLHLENPGKELHEFTAARFFKASRVRNPESLAHQGEEVVLQPGESKDVFLVVDRPGHYDLTCADHDFQGMTGDITVE
jgi:uncharacterized cupredoxin-like copper-binding protein